MNCAASIIRLVLITVMFTVYFPCVEKESVDFEDRYIFIWQLINASIHISFVNVSLGRI